MSYTKGNFTQHEPFSGRVLVCLFGRPLSWSINSHNIGVYENLSIIASKLGLKKIYAPDVSTFNAQICLPEDLGKITALPSKDGFIHLCRGHLADGVELPAKTAFWVSSADCTTIITIDPLSGKTIVAHGGRDSLWYHDGHNTVVESIIERYHPAAIQGLQVFLTCGIGPEHFSHPLNHPKFGGINQKMVSNILSHWSKYGAVLYGDPVEGRLCLSEIIRAQFIQAGVPAHHIAFDGIDTYADTDSDGQYLWWSHRRGDGNKRNGVLVVRNY